ncbi:MULTISPECIES: hypothetical protein [unclassified Lentimonas]|uniref:hypothetical protein n=1 Tax=unclassified Lentimonas TaxID=2630993 RepID=UPI00138954F4|nr:MULTISPECIES: hypothetical protein [unclassified Lentimonas]
MNKKKIALLLGGMLLLIAVDIVLPISLFFIWDLDGAFDGNSSANELRRDIARIGFIVIIFPAFYAVQYLLIKSTIEPKGMLARLVWRLRMKEPD